VWTPDPNDPELQQQSKPDTPSDKTEGAQKPGQKKFSICPFCGEELNLPKQPKFCPYCKEAFS
jgi:hypothetical protein